MVDITVTIGTVASRVAVLALLIVVAKFVAKHIGAKTADRFLMRIHRPAGYTLAVAGLIHGVLSFHVFSTTPILAYVLGCICLLSILAALVTFIFKKKLGAKWLLWHRATTAIALVTLVLHPVLNSSAEQGVQNLIG